LKAPIIDFDFSSCLECSTPEDDPISLKYHERTWISRFQALQGLNWGFKDNGMRAALTFLTRYYRFGGRKAAYRLLHPLGHRIRFRHDNDMFYFERLPGIILKLWPEAAEKIPKIMEFTATVARYLHGIRPGIDYFISGGFDEKRQYYTDMYPQ
jgi:hypothetical protein